jgi:hypothetical protein
MQRLRCLPDEAGSGSADALGRSDRIRLDSQRQLEEAIQNCRLLEADTPMPVSVTGALGKAPRRARA